MNVSAHSSSIPHQSSRFTWVVLTLIGLLALAAGWYFRSGDVRNIPDPWGSGQTLLGVSLPDLNGKEQALAQWKGKVLIVNFWATWCVPCREEMPEFVKLQKEFGDRGVQFVGIAVDDPAKVKQFSIELGLNYPALIGGYGAVELSRSLGNSVGALPFTLVLDRAGSVSRTQLGPIKTTDLRDIIGHLLSKPP
jgi:thiol-disulfide isomerase/thioredoxin